MEFGAGSQRGVGFGGPEDIVSRPGAVHADFAITANPTAAAFAVSAFQEGGLVYIVIVFNAALALNIRLYIQAAVTGSKGGRSVFLVEMHVQGVGIVDLEMPFGQYAGCRFHGDLGTFLGQDDRIRTLLHRNGLGGNDQVGNHGVGGGIDREGYRNGSVAISGCGGRNKGGLVGQNGPRYIAVGHDVEGGCRFAGADRDGLFFNSKVFRLHIGTFLGNVETLDRVIVLVEQSYGSIAQDGGRIGRSGEGNARSGLAGS